MENQDKFGAMKPGASAEGQSSSNKDEGKQGPGEGSDFNKWAKDYQSSKNQSSQVPLQQNHKQPRKVNNVWVEVREEEALEETLKSFETVTTADNFVIRRGVESYDVGPKRRTRKRPVEETSPANGSNSSPAGAIKKPNNQFFSMFSTSSDEEDKEENTKNTGDKPMEYVYDTDSSISSGGISEDSYSRLRTLEPRKKAMAKRRIRSGVKSRTIGKQEKPKAEIAAVNESQPTVPTEIKPGQVLLEEKMAKLDDENLGFFMAKQLKEPKDHLFVRAIQVLKREDCLKLFRKTMKIERAGGLLIKDQTRRRSPGGVFFYLLRMDQRLDKACKDLIFLDDVKEFKQKKRGRRMGVQVAELKHYDQKDEDMPEVGSVAHAQQLEKDKVLLDEFHKTLDDEASYQLPKSYQLIPPPLQPDVATISESAPKVGLGTGTRELISYDDLDF